MSRGTHVNLALLFSLCISLFGLFTIPIFAAYTPKTTESLPWRKPLVGSLFILICMSGLIAVLFPTQCSKAFCQVKKSSSAIFHSGSSDMREARMGHHPNCGRFSTHVVKANEHVVCAACGGLLLGTFIALFTSVPYFLDVWRFELPGFYAVVIGEVLVVIGFFQLKSKGLVRLTLNMLLVSGACVVLIGMDMLAESLFIDLYLVGLIAVWIWTRILLSEWDHSRTCSSCTSRCELKKG